jgi:hypothetical protein
MHGRTALPDLSWLGWLSVRIARADDVAWRWLLNKTISPCADGAVVAVREGDPLDLVETEQADSAMFLADAKAAFAASAQPVCHDDDLSLRDYLVDPAIEEGTNLYGNPELLPDLTREACFRGFSGLEPPSWQSHSLRSFSSSTTLPRSKRTPFIETGNTIFPSS